MLGWFADSFRFAWALLYWNVRKSWFRLRRGRVACPCQSPSDSGRPLETGCEACLSWHRPSRFRRVCPLLVDTPDGLRCSVHTADVRPFWGITLRYYGGALLAVYAAVVLSVFGFLRTIGYPVSIVHVGLPPLWHRVGQARGWFFMERSRQAFAAGNTSEGLLYLANSFEFDPTNYEVGLSLAKAYQVGQPSRSDEIYAQLLRTHPAQRHATAQDWFRALLARGDFERVTQLAEEEVLLDTAHAHAWLRALLFATKHGGDDTTLRTFLALPAPAAARWKDVLQTELLVRAGRAAEAREALLRPWPANSPPFTVVYRVSTLTSLGDPLTALHLLEQNRRQLDDEAWITLRLDALAAANARTPLLRDFDQLIGPPLNQPRLKVACAQLIRHPDRELFTQLASKLDREPMPLTSETAGGWFSVLCTAGAVDDQPRLHALTLRLRDASENPFIAPLMVESFFRTDAAKGRATSFLPFLPLPLEVTYALLERYPAPVLPRPAAAPRP